MYAIVWHTVEIPYTVYRSRGKNCTKKRAKTMFRYVRRSRLELILPE